MVEKELDDTRLAIPGRFMKSGTVIQIKLLSGHFREFVEYLPKSLSITAPDDIAHLTALRGALCGTFAG